jgi:glycosyltransferase involved in cell wall biosynthesis
MHRHTLKRIALISEHASPLAAIGGVDSGGQNIYVAHVARELARLGHSVDVFTRREDAHSPVVVPFALRARVVHVPAGPARVLPKEALLPCMPAFGKWMLEYFIQQRASGRDYDLAHANFFMSGMAGLRAKRALGCPLVMTFHALGRVRRLHQGASDGFPDERFAIEEELARCTDRLVAECPQDRDDLMAHYRAAPERIDVVPCGFDARQFHPVDKQAARAALGWDPRAFCILQLGRLVPRKGIDNVILGLAAMQRLRDAPVSHAPPVRLYVVGGNSDEPDEQATPEIARLRALAREAGVAANVVFTGRRGRDQLRLFYGAADVFVTTPWYEPFGITPVEAMACARPVVGAGVGGIRSTVVDGETGFLVPPQAPQALAVRLAQLMADPMKAAAMGEAGLQRARRHYTWEGVARQLATVYERAMAGASSPGRERHQPEPAYSGRDLGEGLRHRPLMPRGVAAAAGDMSGPT